MSEKDYDPILYKVCYDLGEEVIDTETPGQAADLIYAVIRPRVAKLEEALLKISNAARRDTSLRASDPILDFIVGVVDAALFGVVDATLFAPYAVAVTQTVLCGKGGKYHTKEAGGTNSGTPSHSSSTTPPST